MALQSKTFTWGSYAYQSESNAYVLELTLTENSTSTANNTSEIGYTLKLKSGSQNRFQCDVTSTLKLNGVTVATKTENKYLNYNSEWTLLSGTATVTHNSDGALNMPIVVSIDATNSNSYAPPDKTLNWNWALTTIPRASSITSAGAVTLGGTCSVKWTPNSSGFRYKLQFSLGSWSYTTGAIHPNTTGAYLYTGCVIPLEAARQITDDDEDTMTVTLTTYSDSGCTVSLGSDSETFKVTVPQNADTQPAVTMELTPGGTSLAGLYLQGKSKVQATLSAAAKLGAKIESYSMTAEGKSYPSPYLSNCLTKVGNLEITGCAVDSRGIPGYAKQTITVLPYYSPRLTGVAAYRCNADGKAAENGKYLKIEATRDYAPVVSNGVQKNFCSIQYRYKAEKATGYSSYVTILSETASSNAVVTAPLLDAALSPETSYTVQIVAVDKVGSSSPMMISIPSESIFRHKRAGGKGMGLGGYCESDDLLDVHWNQRARKNLRVDGDISVFGSIGGAYIRKVRVWGESSFQVQTKYSAFDGDGNNRQSVFLFGSNNTYLIYGIIGVKNSGYCSWSGTEEVSVEAGGEGIITVTLPAVAYDYYVLISAEPISIIS